MQLFGNLFWSLWVLKSFRSDCSSVSASAHRGQAWSRVFLKPAHWSAAVRFVWQGGRGREGGAERLRRSVFGRRRGFLAPLSFKQIHFVLLRGNPMIYTAGLRASQQSQLITKGIKIQSLDKCEHTNPGELLRWHQWKEYALFLNKKRCSFAFESVLKCTAQYTGDKKTPSLQAEREMKHCRQSEDNYTFHLSSSLLVFVFQLLSSKL